MKIRFIKSKLCCRTRSLVPVAVMVVMAIGLTAGPTAGQISSSARSIAMGGAYTALATGVEAAKYNPANLGLSGYQRTGFELVGLGASIVNNSFTLGDYNQYTGAFLTADDKADILGKIPSEGLKLKMDVNLSTLSISKGPFAFSIDGIGAADVNLNKDLVDLVLNGNSLTDVVEITGSYSEAIGYLAFGLSYGRQVYAAGTRQLAVGATVRYLRGLAVEEVVELEGLLATALTGFSGSGKMVARTATGGTGYAVDIGTALKLNDTYTVGLRFKNLLGSIKWNSNTEEHGYLFDFDTMTIDNMSDDYVVSDDYTKDIGSFSTSMPTTMNVGFAKQKGRLLWAVDWQQGFRRRAGSSTRPRLSAGLEWLLLKQVPLRAGLGSGGSKNTTFSFGSGLNLGGFYLDYAVLTGTSLSTNSSKGATFAVSTGLSF